MLKKLSTTMRGLSTKTMVRRPALSFITAVPDPCRNLKPANTHERAIKEEVTAVHTAIGDRLKADAKRKKLATAADDYFVVAFESGAQATAFLRAIQYPDPESAFIDGTILADILGIKLPVVTERTTIIKEKHDKSLTALVHPAWAKKVKP